MHVVEGISDRVVALDHGIKIVEGSFEQVATDPKVVEAYLGPRRRDRRASEQPASARGHQHLLRADPHPAGLSIEVDEGELVCLLGGNASGKSTTLKTILGIVKPRTGRIEFDGEDVDDAVNEPPHRSRHRDRA